MFNAADRFCNDLGGLNRYEMAAAIYIINPKKQKPRLMSSLINVVIVTGIIFITGLDLLRNSVLG